MKYTLYWIVLILGIIVISIIMDGKSETGMLWACFIWGFIVSIFFDIKSKEGRNGKRIK